MDVAYDIEKYPIILLNKNKTMKKYAMLASSNFIIIWGALSMSLLRDTFLT